MSLRSTGGHCSTRHPDSPGSSDGLRGSRIVAKTGEASEELRHVLSERVDDGEKASLGGGRTTNSTEVAEAGYMALTKKVNAAVAGQRMGEWSNI